MRANSITNVKKIEPFREFSYWCNFVFATVRCYVVNILAPEALDLRNHQSIRDGLVVRIL